MKPYNTNMFDSIKAAIEKAKNKNTGGAVYKNILQLEAPGTYVVRLLPNIKQPEETILHYFHHGWNSIETGQYGSVVSPATWGDRCPVSELYFKILREGSQQDIERAKVNLRRKENWLVNVFVVSDPKKPENNGTVKVLRYGRQLDKIIQSAINGDDAGEFGSKIFDLSPEGCSLRIKAELVSDKPGAPKYPTYTASKFLNPSAIEGLTEERMQEIYNTVFDLNTFIERKSVDEIKTFIDENYFGKNKKASSAKNEPEVEDTSVEGVEVEDDVSYEHDTKKTTASAPASTNNEPNDDRVKALLEGLDD